MFTANHDFANKASSKLPKSRKHKKESRRNKGREKGQKKKSQLALKCLFS